MEDFFPFLQNAADTDFHFGAHLPQRRHAGVPMHSPSSQLPFKLSNEYINRAQCRRASRPICLPSARTLDRRAESAVATGIEGTSSPHRGAQARRKKHSSAIECLVAARKTK